MTKNNKNNNTGNHKDRYRLASEHLAKIDADWAQLIITLGMCTHLPKPERDPYEALVRAVAYQQLHARAADAILGRLLALYQQRFPTAEELQSAEEELLRSCGFSRRKIVTLKAIAEAALSGLIPCRSLADKMTDEELILRLTSLPGIGRWTVEMLLIYTLERLDIFPLDDFGVRNGYRKLKSLKDLPSRKMLQQVGLACSPYGTIAAWYLWRASALTDDKKTLENL
ncbi:MAG TPA: DNA-3-methyladenine glycosylase [Cellvibrio sp.]|nr:DNA-3-methyladenine glycosylase [Cellvibrio sp.]